MPLSDEVPMSNLPMEVVDMLGQTIAKVVPVTIVLAVIFTVLAHFWACNPGKPWWRKRELVTDVCYWFFVPLFARVFRIGLLVVGAGFVVMVLVAQIPPSALRRWAPWLFGVGMLMLAAVLVIGDQQDVRSSHRSLFSPSPRLRRAARSTSARCRTGRKACGGCR
jgi:hypothetical protein